VIVTPIPCLSDNYAYLVECEATGDAVVVDASEAAPVATALAEKIAAGKKIVGIWSTHHHWDHVGGNEELAAKLGVKDVIGHASDKGRLSGQTRFVDEGDELKVGAITARILHIPGHTTGAIAYVLHDGKGQGAVFTGDTLFLGGCGRLFEGTPEMMHTSLSKLARLAGDTRVYCGHEYTASNLRFAAHVEPGNARVRDRAARLAKPSVPGTIAEELETNPFLRVDSAEIRATLGIAKDASPSSSLGAIRAAKDTFK